MAPALDLEHAVTGERLRFAPELLVVAGFTGRDAAAARAHVEELRRIGVAAPERIPARYDVPAGRLTTAAEVVVGGPRTSGEVEPALLRHASGWLVAAGSDHTDRDLERRDVAASKRDCPKVVSSTVVRLDEVAGRWDELVATSWAGDGDDPYQRAPLAALLPPGRVLDACGLGLDSAPVGTAVLCGTVPLLAGGFAFSDHFRAELAVPGGPVLRLRYRVRVQPSPAGTLRGKEQDP